MRARVPTPPNSESTSDPLLSILFLIGIIILFLVLSKKLVKRLVRN